MADFMKLGKTQAAVLRCLKEHKQWHSKGWGCGWIWSTNSETRRVLDSLVKRGLVEKDTHGVYRPANLINKE